MPIETQLLLLYLTLAAFSFLLTVTEWIYDSWKRNPRSHTSSWANFEIGGVFYILQFIVMGPLVLQILFHLSSFAVFSFPRTISVFLVCLLISDFGFYWVHRLKHTLRFFWSWHFAHHTSTEYNLSISYRLPWIEPFVDWMFTVPLILLGFPPMHVVFATLFVSVGQHWLHTSKIGKLGFLEGVINTPSAHRVHHGTDPEYFNKNFGGLLSIWDRMFGTYAVETKTPTYGLHQNLQTTNPLKINFQEMLSMLKDLKGKSR